MQQIALFTDERPQRPNDGAGAVAWQKQLRDRYLPEGTPPVPHLDLRRAVVRPISRSQAARVIFKYEWLGTMSTSRWHYGIWFGEFCAGVTCVADGSGTAGAWTAAMLGIAPSDLAILVRGACVHWAVPGTNSKLVAWTARLLRQHAPRLKALLAYSDEEAGEIGTIYQACNWTCIGKTDSRPLYVAPDGRTRDRKFISNRVARAGLTGQPGAWAEQHRRLVDEGWKRGHGRPKWRYVYPLDRADRALADRIETMRKPYPKRSCVASIVADAPAVQVGEGGSTPTATLQTGAV